MLLFSVRNTLFGVDAGQVEELLNIEDVVSSRPFGEECRVRYNARDLQILDFSSRLQLHERLDPWRNFHAAPEKSAFCARNTAAISMLEPSPKVLLMKQKGEGMLRGIYIEYPKQLLSISVGCIHRLPVLMREKKLIEAIWGIALVEGCPIVLVDLERL